MTFKNVGLLVFNYKYLIILIFINILGVNLNSQSLDNLNFTADSCIKNLKDGILIVRLKSEKKKLEYLKNQLDLSKNDVKNSNNIQEVINKTIADRDTFNQTLIAAFEGKYKFSKYNFIYDSDYKEWKENNFPNSKLILKNENHLLKSKDEFYLILKHDNTTSGLEALIFIDSKERIIPRSFPNNIRVNNLKVAIWSIGKLEGRNTKNAIRMARAINSKLFSNYRKV
jgi:hypothetical protein